MDNDLLGETRLCVSFVYTTDCLNDEDGCVHAPSLSIPATCS